MYGIKWNICPYLHAMSDFGFAHEGEPRSVSGRYGRSHTNDAECYAECCHRRGVCLRAVNIRYQKVDNFDINKNRLFGK
ncbi:MAG: hypothetical protein WC479_06015 [Candidatus Izemoplasmatales bacterium]